MFERCRICNESIKDSSATDLFAPEYDVLVTNIKLLTGEWLKFEATLPSHICICCETDLKDATAFRERCIATQSLFKQKILQTDSDSIEMEHNMLLDMSDYEDGFDEDDIELHSIHEEDTINNNGSKDEFNFVDEIDSAGTDTKSTSMSIAKKDRKEVQSQTKIIKPRRKYINWRNYTEKEEIELKRIMRRRDSICDQCGRQFKDLSNLKLHILRHTGIKKFICTICGRLFYTSNLLRQHEKTHLDTAVYSCKYCNKSFKYRKVRLEHERRHRGERFYFCKLCDKSFYTANILQQHQLVHTQIRNFYCKTCDKRFLCRKNLIAHNKSKFHNENEEKQSNQLLEHLC